MVCGTRKAKGESEARRERFDVSAKYHPGEIEIQERAGVRSMAERVGNSIHPTIPPASVRSCASSRNAIQPKATNRTRRHA